MNKNIISKKGFTLIELIIVMAIITIMTAVGLVSIQSRKNTTQLEVAVRDVSAAIREAQNNALTGKNASSACTQYKFTYGNSSYSVGGGGCPLVTYTLKDGVTFTNSGSFDFSIPFGRMENIAGDSSIHLNKGTGNDYYISLYSF